MTGVKVKRVRRKDICLDMDYLMPEAECISEKAWVVLNAQRKPVVIEMAEDKTLSLVKVSHSKNFFEEVFSAHNVLWRGDLLVM